MEPTIKVGVDSFYNYLKNNAAQAEPNKKNDLYYHVNVVAEAYTEGFSKGEKQGKEKLSDVLLEKLTDRIFDHLAQIYVASKAVSTYFQENGYKVDKLYINTSLNKPKVIISLPEEQLLDDTFVEFAYAKIHEVKCAFNTMFQNSLDLSLITSDNIDEELLISDGFGYIESF